MGALRPEDAETTGVKQPVFAILTIDDGLQLFRGNRANFADLIRTGREQGFLTYVVTVKQLKLRRSQVRGYMPDESGMWREGTFPLPNIVYNRVPMREDELLPAVRRKIDACLKHPRIKLFNPAFFDKWTLFEWLRSSPSTKAYIPATRRLVSARSLGRMLSRHPYLYLKPIGGKAGAGIMSVRLRPERPLPFQLRMQKSTRSKARSAATLPRLWALIEKRTLGAPYIAQQGIELLSFQDRQFDLRALVQKNGLGRWDVTGIGARLAGSSSITTHVPRGGSIEDPEKLIRFAFAPEQARQVMAKARSAALQIAKQIERASRSSLGEMSMDLGVDSKGRIWFFEANAKPMKFDEPHIRRKSLERIFQYSTYLMRRKTDSMGGA